LAAIHFGRGLQSVNILRNREEDNQRGVNFYPTGWTEKQMFSYARKNLDQAKTGIALISKKSFRFMVDIPLALAEATLQASSRGHPSSPAARYYRSLDKARSFNAKGAKYANYEEIS